MDNLEIWCEKEDRGGYVTFSPSGLHHDQRYTFVTDLQLFSRPGYVLEMVISGPAVLFTSKMRKEYVRELRRIWKNLAERNA